MWWAREVQSALRAGISRDRWLNLTPAEFAEELDAFAWRERRLDARAITTAWFTEYYARVRVLPKLHEHMEELLGERPAASEETPTDEERTAAAARAWNSQLAAIWSAQEAARAAGA